MDETAVLEYLRGSSGPLDFLIKYFQIPDNHPPLYYLLVITVYKLFPAGAGYKINFNFIRFRRCYHFLLSYASDV